MRTERTFAIEKQKHIILLPGLIAPTWSLFPLARYLRSKQKECAVTAISLRLSVFSFNSLVARATDTITQNLLQKSRPSRVILFGHSHGGRVACAVVGKLQKAFPETEYFVITAGTPMTLRPNNLSWVYTLYFNISKAFREWPSVAQPDSKVVTHYIGYYSTDDHTVTQEFAKSGHTGELIELHGLSHHDLISPTKMGSVLLDVLKEL